MAAIFLKSGTGNDGNAGTQKEAPKATLQAALTAAGAGGFVYVSDLHAESGAGTTLTSPGTFASPTVVVCVPDWGAATGSGAPTSRSTGATWATSAVVDITGAAYYYGISISTSSTSATALRFTTTAETVWAYMEACVLALTANSATPSIAIGRGANSSTMVHLHNTMCSFAHVGQKISVQGRFKWTGTASAVAGAAVPTALLITANTGWSPIVEIEGVDLSALGSGKAWVDVANSAGSEIWFVNCKAGSSVSFTTGAHPSQGGVIVTVINCDSADTQTRYFRQQYQASETSETTIVRTGGASEWGTSSSRKIVTTANAKTISPYESLPIEFPNDVIGSPITVTIPVLTDGVTLNDAEAWIEAEYLGTPGFPLGLFVSDRVSDPIFGTPANQTTDSSSSWIDGSIGSPVKQSLSVTFTPQEKGIVRVRVMVAKASTTVYYDPKAISASGRQYQSEAGFVNEGASAMPNIFDSAIIRAVHP